MARKRKATGERRVLSVGSSVQPSLVDDIHIQMPPLHTGQDIIRRVAARFIILACGRRWGKTRLASALSIEEAAANRGLVWWIAPSYKTARPGWRIIQALARQIPGAQIRKSDQMIEFPGGGELWAKSGEDPDALRGEGLTLAVLDEAAFMKRAVWEQAIRAALSDKLGRGILISTPSGYNYFYELYNRGLDPLFKDWASYSYTTGSNPYIEAQEVQDAKDTLPDRIFRQEYMAEFITDAGVVFRKISEAVQIGSDLGVRALGDTYPRRGFSYVLGGDWARMHDFSVFYVAEVETKHIIHMDRFTGVDWDLQRERLKQTMKKYNVHFALLEENAAGQPQVEALQNEGLPVMGFSTQSTTKDLLIRDLVLAFEKEELGLIDDPVTIAELNQYSMKRLPSGRWRYEAPEGGHDDCVMGLALTNRAIAEGSMLASFV